MFGEVEWVDGVLDEEQRQDVFLRTSGIGMLKFIKGGCAFTLQGHGILAPNDITCCIVGEKGYLKCSREEENIRSLYLITEISKEKIELPEVDPYQIDTDNFINEIKGKTNIVVPPEEAVRTIKVCRALAQSAREHKRIYL